MKKKDNDKANVMIKRMFEDRGIQGCEVSTVMNLGNCVGGFWTTNAHRHKRNWYLGRPELLYDYNQVIKACINCHMQMEKSAKLTAEVFELLRGKDGD